MSEFRNAYIILVGIYEGKRQLGKVRHRRKNNVKNESKKIDKSSIVTFL
jgi:hypothetical protein